MWKFTTYDKWWQKNPEYLLNYSFPCNCSKNLSSFRFIIKQQWTIEEISIFSNSSHLEWRVGLSDTILKGTHPRTIPARFGLIWFRGFREDLNVEVYDVRRTTSDGKSSHGLWAGELKTVVSSRSPCLWHKSALRKVWKYQRTDKKKNNDPQNTTQKTKDLWKQGWCSGKVSNSCSNSDICHITHD